MAGFKQILLVAKDGNGGLVNFPEALEYPEKKKVAERWFFNTGRFRTLDGVTSAVFTEQGFTLNLDDYADPKSEEEVVIESNARAELDEIFGEDSIFADMVIEWHNRHLNNRI